MKYFGAGLSEKHKELGAVIRKPAEIEKARALFLQLHAKLHCSAATHTEPNEVDALLNDLKKEEYAVMPTAKDETIAWVLWHTARIEDLTMNMLAARGDQLFNADWQKRMNVGITDTGNALSDDEIMGLSKEINVNELLRYRNEVGQRTQEWVKSLQGEEMRRKTDRADLERVLSAGGVTADADSVWLLDFWGGKDVAGLLLMPPTRHVILHLNDCCKWKEWIRSKKSFYRR